MSLILLYALISRIQYIARTRFSTKLEPKNRPYKKSVIFSPDLVYEFVPIVDNALAIYDKSFICH